MCLSVFGLLQRTFFLQPLLILSTATKFRIYFPPRVIGQLASIFHRPLSPSGTWVGALQIEALVSYGSENIFRPKLFKMLISGIIYKYSRLRVSLSCRVYVMCHRTQLPHDTVHSPNWSTLAFTGVDRRRVVAEVGLSRFMKPEVRLLATFRQRHRRRDSFCASEKPNGSDNQ